MARAVLHPLTIALGAGCVLAGALVVYELRTAPYGQSVAPAAEGDMPEIAAAPSWAMRPGADFAGILARPIFSEGRRPPQLEPDSGPVAAGSSSDLTVSVTAVILTPERQIALVQQTPGETLFLTEGDELDGWRLVEIGAEHLVFDAGSRTRRVALKDLPAETETIAPLAADAGAVPSPEAEAFEVMVDGRMIEILPEFAGNRGEGTVLSRVSEPDPESTEP